MITVIFMANELQKILYNLSVAAPLLIVFSFVWIIQKKTWTVPVFCIAIACILIVYLLWLLSYGRKHFAPMTIRASEIAPNDGSIMVYIISYVLPFASLVVDDVNVLVFGLVGLVIALGAAFANTPIPNPILFCRKYHFYSVSAENGVTGYILISRRKLRKKQDLKNVNRVFEFLLLDTEE